jgi:hypothetical protein
VSAYGSSPFFEYYRDDFQPFFERKHTFLFDLNEELRRTISRLLDLDDNVAFSDNYLPATREDVHDFREIIHPKKQYSLDASFRPSRYYQVFESKFGFLPNLSIIDLLFNMGTESLLILGKSKQ